MLDGMTILRPEHLRHVLLGSMLCHVEAHRYFKQHEPSNLQVLADNKRKATILRDFAEEIPYEFHKSDTKSLMNQRYMQLN